MIINPLTRQRLRHAKEREEQRLRHVALMALEMDRVDPEGGWLEWARDAGVVPDPTLWKLPQR